MVRISLPHLHIIFSFVDIAIPALFVYLLIHVLIFLINPIICQYSDITFDILFDTLFGSNLRPERPHSRTNIMDNSL